MNFQENSSNGSPDTAEKAHFSSSEVPLILTNWNKAFNVCSSSVDSASYEFSGKVNQGVQRYSREGTLLFK
jgi:hypothetical protein